MMVMKNLLGDAVSRIDRTIAAITMAPTTAAIENPARHFFLFDQLQ
jgi:hypothetical protein